MNDARSGRSADGSMASTGLVVLEDDRDFSSDDLAEEFGGIPRCCSIISVKSKRIRMKKDPVSFGQRLGRALRALLGQAYPAEPDRGSELGGEEAMISRAKIERAEALRNLRKMREDYAALETRHELELSSAGNDEIIRLIRHLGPLVSELATMRVLAAGGLQVSTADLLTLVGKLEAALVDAGIQPIGIIGAEAEFDSEFHQNISGGVIKDGGPVCIRFVGYIRGDQVITKALVSCREGFRD